MRRTRHHHACSSPHFHKKRFFGVSLEDKMKKKFFRGGQNECQQNIIRNELFVFGVSTRTTAATTTINTTMTIMCVER